MVPILTYIAHIRDIHACIQLWSLMLKISVKLIKQLSDCCWNMVPIPTTPK